MMADITEGEGAQKCVTKRVDRDISVRMGHEARRTLDPHTTQPHRKSFLQLVYVISLTDPEFVHVLFPLDGRRRFRRDVVDDAVHTVHLGDNLACHLYEEFNREVHNLCGHSIH